MNENIKLLLDDSREVLKRMKQESIDLTVTSPPYDNLRDYNGIGSEWNFETFKGIGQELYRITKQGGVVVWIVSDATIGGSETGTSFKQALYFKELGFNLHDTMIWEKPTFTATGSLRCRYASVFEYMFVLSKGRLKTFNPIKDKPNKWAGNVHCATTIRTKEGLRKMSHSHTIASFGVRHNVWHISPCKSKNDRVGHPAPFPISLARDHILSWSNETDVVLDPFMGSGTTGVACLETGRRFIGIEKDPRYFAVAKSRIDKTLATPRQPSLF